MGENDMTYVSREHLYNEGGEVANHLLHERKARVSRSRKLPFTDLGILTLLIASVLEAKPFGAHAEDCIQLQAGEGD